MRILLFLLAISACTLAPSVTAQARIGFSGSAGVANSQGGKAALLATWEYRRGTRAYSVRGVGAGEIFGDSAAELAVMGGVAQSGRGLGDAWFVAGPSLFVYEERHRSCLFSGGEGWLGGSPCTPASTYSFHPGLSVGAGATLVQLGSLGLGGYLFGNLNPKAPMLGATLMFSITGPAGGSRGAE